MARVLAGEDLPFAALSPQISVRAVAIAQQSQQDKILVELDSGGRLRTDDGLARLVRSLPLARDFHSCTVLLERGSGGTVHLQTSRPLRSGEPLYLWFSTDLQAQLGISFLSPNNIRGEKNYLCHYCGDSFEYPNPLKLHIALDCERTKLPGLWTRLWEVLSEVKYPDSPRDSASSSPPPQHKYLDSPTGSGGSSPTLESEGHCWRRSSSAPLPPSSAFRPYLGGKHQDLHHHHPAARIEQLVSSLGHSKQGHLCLYCGKVYSRKYGLKIHIRTHTGFKPLKCKYCLRPFGDPSNLNKHVRLHSESDTPYRCELCGKMLVRKRDLDRHMSSRHNLPKIN